MKTMKKRISTFLLDIERRSFVFATRVIYKIFSYLYSSWTFTKSTESMNETSSNTELEESFNSLLKLSPPPIVKSRSNKRVSIQFDPNRSIVAAGVSEKLLNQPGLENVKLYIEEIKCAYDSAALQNKETLEKLENLRKKLDDVTDAYENENLRLKNSISLSDYSQVKLTQEIKLLKRHLSIKDQDDSEVKQKLNETLQSYDDLKEELQDLQEENTRLKDTIILIDSYEEKIKEYGEMVKVLVQDKDILEIRLSGLQKELQKQMLKSSNPDDGNVDIHLCNAMIKRLEKKNDELLNDLDKLKNEKINLENIIKQLRNTIYNLENDLKYFQDQVVDEVKLIENQKKQLNILKIENNNLNEANMHLNEQLKNTESSFLMKENKLQEQISSIIYDSKVSLEKVEQDSHNEREKLIQQHNDALELLQKKHQDEIKEIRRKEEEKIEAMKVQFNEQLDIVAIAATSRSEDKIKELKGQVKNYELQVNQMTIENQKLMDVKAGIDKELKDAKIFYTTNLKEKCDECTELTKSLSFAKEELNNYEGCIQRLETDVMNYRNDIETILKPTVSGLTEQNKKLEEQFIEKYTLSNNLQMELEEKKKEIEILKMQRDNNLQQASKNIELQNNSSSDHLLHELAEYKRYSLELQEAYNSLKLNSENQTKIINEGKIYTDFITKKLEEKEVIINDLNEKLIEAEINSRNNERCSKNFSENEKELLQDQYLIHNTFKEDNKSILVCKNCEKLAKDISSLNIKAQDLIAQISFMQNQINGLSIQANSYSDKIEQLEQQIEVYEEERLEHETTENEMQEKIKKLELDNTLFSKEINCLKEQLCYVNQELIIKDQELSRHHEQLLILEIEKEKISREKRKSDLYDDRSKEESMISKEIYETILSDSQMLISDLRDFVDRISITLESLMSRPFPTLPEVDYPSMINIAKAVIQLIELIPSKETNDHSIINTTNPHIEELNNKIRYLEDKLCENNQNWESFYKIEHDCRMSFEEKLKAAEEQISRLTVQLLEDKGIEEMQKTLGDSAITIIPPELLSSVPIGIKMKISILAAKLSTKMLDNDALLRANKEIADTNVLLQNRVDYYKEKLESLTENSKDIDSKDIYELQELHNYKDVNKKSLISNDNLTEDTTCSQTDIPIISNTESASSIISIAGISKDSHKNRITTDDENEDLCSKSNTHLTSFETKDIEVNLDIIKNNLNEEGEEIYSFIETCTNKNTLTINKVNAEFFNKCEMFNCMKILDLRSEDSEEMTLKFSPTTKNVVSNEGNENTTKSTISETFEDKELDEISSTINEKKIEDVDSQDFEKKVNTDFTSAGIVDLEKREKLKNKKFIKEKNTEDNKTYQNPVSNDNETIPTENKKSRFSSDDHVTLAPKGGSNKISTEKKIIPKQIDTNIMEVFDPFQIPQLPQADEGNIFEDVFAQDIPMNLNITPKQKSTSSVGKKKSIKKGTVGKDIFTNFNLPDMIINPPNNAKNGQKANFNSFNSKGAFVAPDKVSLNREHGIPKQATDIMLLRSETPKDFVPVDFKKEPPKSILKPRALSKPKYNN